MVYEYLASVVLNRQPDDLRRFALDASVLPIMTAEACNVVLEREDSQKYLGRLVSRGLFVTASEGSPRTYEFHPLFRAFLLESTEGADSRNLRKLRRKAAKYHQEQGSTDQAVDLLLEAGAHARAAQLAERYAKEMFETGRIQTLERWAEKLQAHHSKIPNLLLYLASGALNRGELESSHALLSEARKLIGPKSSKDVQAKAEVWAAFLALREGRFLQAIEAADRVGRIYKKRKNPRNQAMALRAKAAALLHSGGDIVLAEQLASESAQLLAGTDDDYQRVAALVDLSMILTAQGKVQEAAKTRDRVLEEARNLGSPLPLAVALGNKARSEHASGEFESALQYGREALKYSRQSASPLREAIALLRQADVFNDIGLTLQAAELYRQSLDILLEVDDVQWIRYGCVQASVLHRRRGGAGVSNEWLKRAIVVDDSKKVPSSVRIQRSALELKAAPDRAIKNLRTLVRKGAQNLEAVELTQVYYFLARAAFEMENEGRSIQTFVEALTLAGRFGTEQAIAAELRFDEDFTGFAFDHLKSDPTLLLIRSRIETLTALERKYESGPEEESTELSLAFEALGDSRVIINGVEIGDLKPLATEILFYLFDHQRVSRDQLMETFWPDYSPGRQVSSLHTAIYSIRRELGKEGIQFDGTVYRVDPELSVQYDVARFEQAATVAEGLPPGDPRSMFALTEAVNLHGGQFLPEFDSEWVDERRRALELRYLDLLASYSEEALIRGQASEAIGWLREALTLDPLRDDTNRFYLEALGTLGRRSEIVTHYQEYVRALGEELGLDPPEDVRELYDRLIS
jgi:two-component SAPR family response regulator